MKKLIAVGIAIVLSGTILCGVSYAGHHRHGCWGGNAGWAAAGGFVGGMVLGSALASASRPYYYSAPAYYYSGPSYYYSGAYAYPVYPTYTTYSTYYPATTYYYY
jgi:hypothetical protein